MGEGIGESIGRIVGSHAIHKDSQRAQSGGGGGRSRGSGAVCGGHLRRAWEAPEDLLIFGKVGIVKEVREVNLKSHSDGRLGWSSPGSSEKCWIGRE